ncbi:MAG TPA: hypothetical protein VMU77_05055 [Acidimicrobiales bacterium]|nr:hypothetical protein [Acidimicrobiales bacterium]
MLFIEYDVNTTGQIELVALIEAIEETGDDPEGVAWHEWRQSHEDEGLGCAKVSAQDRIRLEAAVDSEELFLIVEEIILDDRRTKEEVR